MATACVVSQFHNGSITTKTLLSELAKRLNKSQFHNGSITTKTFAAHSASRRLSLNSTMVRLSRPIIIYFFKVVGSKIPIYRG